MNNRRKLVIALGAGALAAPLGSFAQPQGKVWRVGFLHQSRRPASLKANFIGGFPQGMRELGYVEGKNFVIEWRFADGDIGRMPGLAAELVQLKVDAIVAADPVGVRAAQKATTTIPIIMSGVGDPVGLGFVQSLAHPGGNITGHSNINSDLAPKLLEMLYSMVPKLSRVAVLFNPDNALHPAILKGVEASAQKRNVTILPVAARTPQEIEIAFSQMVHQKAGGLIVLRDGMLNQQPRQIAERAAKNRLPAIAGLGEYVEAGGLMSYGNSITDQYRRVATYVDKILKGAKPGDLPVEQPTKLDLFINGKTARALGLKIPQSLLVMADKVIE